MFDRCRLVQTGLVGQQSYAVSCCMLRHPVQLVGMRTSFSTPNRPPKSTPRTYTRTVSLLRCLDASEYSGYLQPVRPTFVWYPVSRILQQAKQVKLLSSEARPSNTNLVGQCLTLTTAGPASWSLAVSIMGVNPRINTIGAGPPNVEVKSCDDQVEPNISLGHRTYTRCTYACQSRGSSEMWSFGEWEMWGMSLSKAVKAVDRLPMCKKRKKKTEKNTSTQNHSTAALAL